MAMKSSSGSWGKLFEWERSQREDTSGYELSMAGYGMGEEKEG
jgi:hypothetical protein